MRRTVNALAMILTAGTVSVPIVGVAQDTGSDSTTYQVEPAGDPAVHSGVGNLPTSNVRREAAAQDWQALQEIVAQQNRRLEEQARKLREQASWLESYRRALEEQRRELNALQLQVQRGLGVGGPTAPAGPAPEPETQGVAQAEEPSAPGPEGAAPSERERPEIGIIAERGGVLTPKGTLVIEPKLDYSKSTSDRLVFRGISVVEGFLIGVIEATDSDRDTLTGSLTGRYGITDRLEVELEVPYVRRDDSFVSTITGATGEFSIEEELSDHGLGDVEFGAHYQFNRGLEGWPFFVGNLKLKSTTGTGPFDVDRDATTGEPTELATGSGFYGIEPSVTVIWPTDPAVLFANLGYLINLPDDVDEMVGDTLIGQVDPGDTFRVSYGAAFALNPRLSLSLGYSHDFIQPTTTEQNGVDVEGPSLSSGSFLFGASLGLTDWTSVQVTTQIGATEDAPDARILVRVPIRLGSLL